MGMVGDNTAINRSSPISVVGGFTDWIQVDASSTNSIGLRANGTVWTWGRNNNGQLGDNTAINRSSPVSVVGGISNWVQISAGYYHTAAIRANGTLWTWGNNSSGELGDNTAINKSSPISVVGGFTDWMQITAGGCTAAIRANGTLWTWGSNSFGRLGDNTVINRSSPVTIVGGFTDWVQLSTGTNVSHINAVRANGTMWAWGYGGSGRLGDGTAFIARSSPVSVVGGITDWIRGSAGQNHSAGIRSEY
jgi:alpha-tubulin suppressor-like RCC1 family protein